MEGAGEGAGEGKEHAPAPHAAAAPGGFAQGGLGWRGGFACAGSTSDSPVPPAAQGLSRKVDSGDTLPMLTPDDDAQLPPICPERLVPSPPSKLFPDPTPT